MKMATVESYHGLRRGRERRDRLEAWDREILAFTLAHTDYGVDIQRVRELLKHRPVTEVPRAPAFVPGIVAVRGVVLPVVDLRLRLRLPAHETTRASRIMVVTRGAELFGLAVDAVRGVARLREEDVEPPPRAITQDSEFLAGIARPRGGKMLVLLNLDSVLAWKVAK
jgi:purine-binding chemotaxis protein CheW